MGAHAYCKLALPGGSCPLSVWEPALPAWEASAYCPLRAEGVMASGRGTGPQCRYTLPQCGWPQCLFPAHFLSAADRPGGPRASPHLTCSSILDPPPALSSSAKSQPY